MRNDTYNNIIQAMKQRKANVTPLKTRVIADDVGITVYQARYYLEKFNRLHVVERTKLGKGSATLWLLLV